jgi:two-component system, cell cycle sensor histidine kinase and response regulator CckA
MSPPKKLPAKVSTQVGWLAERAALQQRVAELEAQVQQAQASIGKQLQFTEALLAAIPTPVFFKDAQGRYLGCNDAFAEQVGVTSAELYGQTVYELWPDEHALVYHQKDLELLQNPERQSYEFKVRDKNGQEREVIFAKNVFYDEAGQVAGLVGAYVDITAQKRIEEKLLASQKRLRLSENRLDLAMAVKNEGIWDWNLVTNETFFDDRYYTMAGYTPNEFPQNFTAWAERVHPEDIERASDAIKAYLDGQSAVFDVEFRFKHKNGSWIWIQGRGKIVERDAKGAPLRMIGTHTAITERKQAEEALRASEERYRSLIEHSYDAIYVLYDGHFALINQRFSALFDVTPEEICTPDFDFMTLVAPVSRPLIEQRIRQLQAGQAKPARYEFTALTRHGQEIEVEVSVSYITYRDGFAAQGILRDISERKRAAEALARSEQRFRELIELAVDGILLGSPEGFITGANSRMLALLGADKEALLGKHIRDILTPRSLQEKPLRFDLLTRGGTVINERVMQRADGTHVYVEMHSKQMPDGSYQSIVRDVTERQILETQLRRHEQLAAIGQLAAGIAHDFRNILTTIILYAQLGQRRPDLPNGVTQYLGTIIGEANKATDLVQQILDFARRAEIERRPVDLVAFIAKIVSILQRTLPENVHITVDIGAGDCVIEGDVGRLQQALTNLALNARDAMPQGGTLHIGLMRISVAPGARPPIPAMESASAPRTWIYLSIADTGVGMSAEAYAHRFEPFFTTKAPEQGSGLGLAQVYGIVQLHHGHIDVTTESGKGTTFHIYFPALLTPTEEMGVTSAHAMPHS